MRKTSNSLQLLVGIVLVALLLVAIVTVFRSMSLNGPAGAPAATQPAQGYPGQQTSSPQAYPPPQATLPLVGSPLPTLVAVTLHPPQTPTLWLTPTLPPQPTRRPGPSETPIAPPQPAQSSVGFILYAAGTKSDALGEASDLAVFSQPVDDAGQIKNPSQRLTGYTPLSGDLIYAAPDGKRVALVAGVEAGEWISILNTETGKVALLLKTLSVSSGRFFNWHPDSRRVLLGAAEAGPESGLWLVDADTEQLTVLVKDPDASAIHDAAVSPDGQKVIYTFWRGGGVAELRMINIDGTDAHVVATAQSDILLLSWSPDSNRIAYVGDKGYVLENADGTNLQSLAVQNLAADYNFTPVWSPDGHKIAYVAFDGPNPHNQKGLVTGNIPSPFLGTDIHVLDLVTGKDHPLLSDGKTGDIDPTWSPDGLQIAFASVRGGTSQIWIVNADGTNLRSVTSSSVYARHPAWR